MLLARRPLAWLALPPLLLLLLSLVGCCCLAAAASPAGSPTSNPAAAHAADAKQQAAHSPQPILVTHQARWHHPTHGLLGRKDEGKQPPAASPAAAEQSSAQQVKDKYGWGVPQYDKKSIHSSSDPSSSSASSVASGSCRACCYGCKVNQGGFGCEQKCRVCCPEGQAAVCSNEPSCKCEAAPQQQTEAADTPKAAPSRSKLKLAELHKQVEMSRRDADASDADLSRCGNACCYGCKWVGFGCEQKCRICCPEGQAAQCDNTPKCSCSQPATPKAKQQHDSSKDKAVADKHMADSSKRSEEKEKLSSALQRLLDRLSHAVHSFSASGVQQSGDKQAVLPAQPDQPANDRAAADTTQAALSLTDIIIIVVVVVVVLFCCGGFGYTRYRRTSL